MVAGMGVKVCRMAFGAGATVAPVYGRIAMAVGTRDPGAVFAGMAVGAGVVMHGSDRVAGMTGNAEGGGGDRGRMAVGVSSEVAGVATCARAFFDG